MTAAEREVIQKKKNEIAKLEEELNDKKKEL